MAVIAIEMLREHRFKEGARGDLRILPRKWVGEIDEEAAVFAIASGAARSRVPLTKDQALAVEILKAAKAKDYDRIEQLRRENPELLPADPAQTSTETPPATSEAAAKPRKTR